MTSSPLPLPRAPLTLLADLFNGPRDAHRKAYENETGCKIVLRGRGSGVTGDDADDPMFVYVQSDSGHRVEEGVSLVRDLLFDADAREKKQAEQRAVQMGLHGGEGAGFATTTLKPLGADPEYSVHLEDTSSSKTILVSNHQVGKVIGRGGQTIRTLQETSGCRIQIKKQEDNQLDENGQEVRPIELLGTPATIAAAERLIQESISRAPGGGGDGEQRTPGVPASLVINPGDAQEVVMIPSGRVGTIIGRGGETIRKLQMDSGAKIHVQPDRETTPGQMERRITVTGPPPGVNIAKQLITELVTAPPGQRVGGGYGQQQMQHGMGMPPQQMMYGAPQQMYGAPQQMMYGAPQQMYGAPQQMYGAPQQVYAMPQAAPGAYPGQQQAYAQPQQPAQPQGQPQPRGQQQEQQQGQQQQPQAQPQAQQKQQPAAPASAAPAPAADGPPLPEGWSSGKDPTSGVTYYYNPTINKTQWERPE